MCVVDVTLRAGARAADSARAGGRWQAADGGRSALSQIMKSKV